MLTKYVTAIGWLTTVILEIGLTDKHTMIVFQPMQYEPEPINNHEMGPAHGMTRVAPCLQFHHIGNFKSGVPLRNVNI